MGIKNFSKAFNSTRIIKPKNMKDKSIAVDAMTEMYRAALGAKQTHLLTDSSGRPTLHISVVLSNVLSFHKNNVNQVWVFDHEQNPNDDFHNPMKIAELAKRQKRKETALDKIKSLKDLDEEDPLFSDDEDETTANLTTAANLTSATTAKQNKIPIKPADEFKFVLSEEQIHRLADLDAKKKMQETARMKKEAKTAYDNAVTEYAEYEKKNKSLASLEKQAFSLSSDMINDVKLILNFLKIKYIEAPSGFEGEAIASYLNKIGKVDAVYSADTDPIAYGANVLWRRNPKDKEIYEYTIDDILTQIKEANDKFPNPSIEDFLKAAAALGTDACEKTPGIGAKTVLKKLDIIKLNNAQKEALKEFAKQPDISNIVIKNSDSTPFENCDIDGFINWLVTEKSFNRSRITTQINKVIGKVTDPKSKTDKADNTSDNPKSKTDTKSKPRKEAKPRKQKEEEYVPLIKKRVR